MDVQTQTQPKKSADQHSCPFATDKTGRPFVQCLQDQGHQPVAPVQSGSDTTMEPLSIAFCKSNITDLPAGQNDGMDAVILDSGANGPVGADMTNKGNRDGAKHLTDLACATGPQRFVMFRLAGADQPKTFGKLAHDLKASHAAGQHMMADGQTSAILRPEGLRDSTCATDLLAGETVDAVATASRADAAHVLADATTTGRFEGIAQEMQSAGLCDVRNDPATANGLRFLTHLSSQKDFQS